VEHAVFSATTNRAASASAKGQPLNAKAAETLCSHSSTQPVLQLTVMPKRSRRQLQFDPPATSVQDGHQLSLQNAADTA